MSYHFPDPGPTLTLSEMREIINSPDLPADTIICACVAVGENTVRVEKVEVVRIDKTGKTVMWIGI